MANERLKKLVDDLGDKHIKRWDFIKEMADVLGLSDDLHIAEIGVWTGRCSIKLREYFPNAYLYLVDPWSLSPNYNPNYAKTGGPPRGSRKNSAMEEAYQKVCEMFKDDQRVEIMRMPSTKAARLIEQPLDIIFLDGDHSKRGINDDVRAWKHKVRPGGLFCGHDAILFKCVRDAVAKHCGDFIMGGKKRDDVWALEA